MKAVISKEVALVDLENFVNTFAKKPVDPKKLEELYPDVLDAIMEGLFSFENNIPKLKLKEPIKTDSGEPFLSEIEFKTRIKPSVKAELGKGLSIQVDILTYQLKMTAYIIGQPIAIIDKLSPFDYDAVSQICGAF